MKKTHFMVVPNPADVSTEAGMGLPPPRARLNTISGVKAHLAWAIKELEAGTLDARQLNALSCALNALAGIIEDHDLEKRLSKLEKLEADCE